VISQLCTQGRYIKWTRGPGTKDPGPRTQDRGPRTRDRGPGTEDLGTQGPKLAYTICVCTCVSNYLTGIQTWNGLWMNYPYKPCVMYLLDCFTEYSLTHSSCVVHAFVLYVWPEILMTVICVQLLCVLYVYLLTLTPQRSTIFYIHLVKYASDL